MTNKYLRKFGEASKTVGTRVPASQHQFYKERFNSIVNQDFKGFTTNLVSEIIKAMNSFTDFVNATKDVIEYKGSIDISDYNKLYTIMNLGAINSLKRYLKNNSS